MNDFIKGKSKLNEWGAKINDPMTEFKQIDKNDSKSITFDEFLIFALEKDLHFIEK